MIKESLSKILMMGLATLLLLGAIFLVSQTRKKTPLTTTRLPSEVLSPTPAKAPPSRWATDSAVLTIEADLKKLSNDLRAVDLKESSLLPPLLDMEVKF